MNRPTRVVRAKPREPTCHSFVLASLPKFVCDGNDFLHFRLGITHSSSLPAHINIPIMNPRKKPKIKHNSSLIQWPLLWDSRQPGIRTLDGCNTPSSRCTYRT